MSNDKKRKTITNDEKIYILKKDPQAKELVMWLEESQIKTQKCLKKSLTDNKK